MFEAFYTKTVQILRSTKFFYASLVLFVVESSWIALSGVYPMAYDEDTHLGIIRLYTHHVSPIWLHPPAGPAPFGAVSRDPSYLYHYLLSFPYHLFSLLFSSQTAQVLFLRFISVGLFTLGLVLYRRLLKHTGASKALIHAVLLFIILTPVVPTVAAQINYDNLLFPLTAVTLLMAIRCTEQIKRRRKLDVVPLSVLLAVCLLTSLVKYAFLPILGGIMIWVGLTAYRHVKQRSLRAMARNALAQLEQLSRLKQLGLILFVLLAGVLFVERYGINTVRYGTPIPECNQVVGIDRCLAYGPWRRNYLTYQDKMHGLIRPPFTDPVRYTTQIWFGHMAATLFFYVSGPSSQYDVGDPFNTTLFTMTSLLVVGIVLIMFYAKRLLRRYQVQPLFNIGLLYIFTLLLHGYSDFRHLGLAVALQGRYFFPVLPLLYLVFALAYAELLRTRPYLKAILIWLVVAVLLFEGGGVSVFILRGHDEWYWPNHSVTAMNHVAKRLLGWFSISV